MLRAILIFVLPLAVMVGGLVVLDKVTEHKDIQKRLREHGIRALSIGFYGAETMSARWQALKKTPDLIPKERYFLKADLVFPLVYGGALIVGLLVAWNILGRPFGIALLLASIAICMAADWSENLLQLSQIDNLLLPKDDQPQLSHILIAVAGVATAVKWLALGAATIQLACLAWRTHLLAKAAIAA